MGRERNGPIGPKEMREEVSDAGSEQCPLEVSRTKFQNCPLYKEEVDIPRLALRTHFGFPHPNSLFQGCRDHDCDDSRSRRCKFSISEPLSSILSPLSLSLFLSLCSLRNSDVNTLVSCELSQSLVFIFFFSNFKY